MPQLARYRLRCSLLCLTFIIKKYDNKSKTLINIYVVKITFCSLNSLSAGLLSCVSAHHIKYDI